MYLKYLGIPIHILFHTAFEFGYRNTIGKHNMNVYCQSLKGVTRSTWMQIPRNSFNIDKDFNPITLIKCEGPTFQ
jgi:hypothetical protein